MCLTLTEPYPGDNPIQIAFMASRPDPPPLPVHIPEAVRRVVMRALASDPRSRWLSAAAMSEAAAAAAIAHPV